MKRTTARQQASVEPGFPKQLVYLKIKKHGSIHYLDLCMWLYPGVEV